MGDRTFKPTEAGKSQCYPCGKSSVHKRDACPAINATCLKCKKQGHFAVVCRSKKVRSVTDETELKSSRSEDYFLGGISEHENKDDWSVNLSLETTKVRFKVDTGVDVTVIPETDYLRSGLPQLRTTSKTLFGPGREKLPVKGVVKGALNTSSLKKQTVGNLKEPLLGRPAINALNLVQKVEIIQAEERSETEDQVKSTYPKLFKGLGELDGEFSIKLKPDSTPFALTTPRRVATPLLNKVKAELERMENMGVVSKVDVPTEWCAGMIVVPKPDGNVRICVDLTKPNENVLRETYPLPKIDNLLSKISESKIFSKLDCKFWVLAREIRRTVSVANYIYHTVRQILL